MEIVKKDEQKQEEATSSLDPCAICLLEISSVKESCRLEKCKHLFHPSCIHPWVRDLGHKVCPLCRSGGKLICCSKGNTETVSNACVKLNSQHQMRSIIASPLSKTTKKDQKRKKVKIEKRIDSIIMFMEDPKCLFREEF